MASNRSRKAKARETLANQLNEAFSSSTISVSVRESKDTELFPLRQSLCLKCPNWTRCPGYYQLLECTRNAQKEVRNG